MAARQRRFGRLDTHRGGMIAIALIAFVIRVLHARLEEKIRELEDL